MSMDSVIELGKACGRELSQAEAARLREVGSRLHLREDDALWPLLAAMEYQRVYYEALPEKIAGASRAIMDGMAAAAEKETAAAQAKLTDSVVKEAGAAVAAGPDLPAGLRKPHALGGLSHRHRTEYASGGGFAHAIRLADQRAVPDYRGILFCLIWKNLFGRWRWMVENRSACYGTYHGRGSNFCSFIIKKLIVF